MKQQKTVTLFTYIHAVDELIRKSRSSQQVVAAHPSDWAAADLFFLSSGMWMRPKNKRMMTKRIPPPNPPTSFKRFQRKKKNFNFRREISPGPAKRFTTTGQNIYSNESALSNEPRFISNSVPLRQRYIEILPRSSYYASRWEWHTNETRFWRCKRPTPSLHAQQQKSEISIFFPPFKQEIIR